MYYPQKQPCQKYLDVKLKSGNEAEDGVDHDASGGKKEKKDTGFVFDLFAFVTFVGAIGENNNGNNPD